MASSVSPAPLPMLTQRSNFLDLCLWKKEKTTVTVKERSKGHVLRGKEEQAYFFVEVKNIPAYL